MRSLWDKFHSKVELIPFHECWEWAGTLDTCGYGRLYVRKGGKYKYLGAHRASYLLYKGNIPKGLEVRHSCDNPACVNPSHLSIGTHKQNMQDATDRRRWGNRAGSNNPNSVLTEEQVLEIRKKYVPKYGNLTKLAKEYNMSISGMWQVVKETKWKM